MESLTIKIKFDTGEAQSNAKKTDGAVKAISGSLKELEQTLKKQKQSWKEPLVGTNEYKAALESLATTTHKVKSAQNELNSAVASKSIGGTDTLGGLNASLKVLYSSLEKVKIGSSHYRVILDSIKTASEQLRQVKKDLAQATQEEIRTTTVLTGSMADLTSRMTQAKAIRDGLIKGTREWEGANSRVLNLEQLITKQSAETAKLKSQTTSAINVEVGSLTQLNQTLRDAVIARDRLAMGSTAWTSANQNVIASQKMLDTALRQSNVVASQSTRVNANMGQALLAMNYVVRDSPYFFRNFSLGILAIGNNLNPLIDSMVNASKQAKQLNSTLGKELLKSLMGSQGVIFGMSLLVSAIQAVVFWMDGQNASTKKAKEEIEDFSKEINALSASLEQLGKQKIFSEDELKNYIKAQEAQLQLYQNRIKRLQQPGNLVGGIFSDLFISLYTEQQAITEESIRLLKENIGKASPDVEKYGALMGGLVDASKKGSQGILEFAKANRLSEDDLRNLVSVLQDYDKGVLAYGGDTSKFMTDAQDAMSKSIKLTKSELEKVLPLLQSFLNPKQTKPKETTVKNAGQQAATQFEEYTSKAQEALDKARDQFNKAVFEFYSKQQKVFAEGVQKLQQRADQYTSTKILSDIRDEEEALREELAGINNALAQQDLSAFTQGKLEERKVGIEKQLEPVNEEMGFLMSMSDTVGNALYDSFMHGKEGLQGFLDTLKQVVLQMIIVEGLKTLFAGGVAPVGGLFSFLGFQNGGVIPKAQNGMISGSSYSGDRQLVGVNAGEMIINKMQQKNLFDIANGKFGSARNQNITVTVKGTLEANKNKFISSFRKAEKTYDSSRRIGIV